MARRRNNNPSGFNLDKLTIKNTSSNNKFFVGNGNPPQAQLNASDGLYPAVGGGPLYGKAKPVPNADLSELYSSSFSRYERAQGTYPEFVNFETIDNQNYQVSYFPSNQSVSGYWRTLKYDSPVITREIQTTVRGGINVNFAPNLPVIDGFTFNLNTAVEGFDQTVNFDGSTIDFQGADSGFTFTSAGNDAYNYSFDSTIDSTNPDLLNNAQINGPENQALVLPGVTLEGTNLVTQLEDVVIRYPDGREVSLATAGFDTLTPDTITQLLNEGFEVTIPGYEPTGGSSVPTYDEIAFQDTTDPLTLNIPSGDIGGGIVEGTYQCEGEAIISFGDVQINLGNEEFGFQEYPEELLCSNGTCEAEKVYCPIDRNLLSNATSEEEVLALLAEVPAPYGTFQYPIDDAGKYSFIFGWNLSYTLEIEPVEEEP